mmetsp:Transcript_19365/g.59786  ORF Transcript_19365/g.59786 Transcript_19365/m.59786 type:complete len:491 (-) Transcript_19365:2227-3699(-)
MTDFVMVDDDETVSVATAATEETVLRLSAEAEHSVLKKDTTLFTVGASLRAAEATTKRPPVDVVTVQDRSGSMGGEKLFLCKETQKLLLSELKEGDRFGLVSFDNTVKVEVPLGAARDVSHVIDRVRAGATTNLSGGLFKGIDLFSALTDDDDDDDSSKERVRALLLLTDGIANVGITDPDALVAALGDVLDKFPKTPPAVFTFGYGADTNAKLLQQLAQRDGKGGYYFVDSTDRVVGAFADCLGGLLSVVAQTAVLDVKVKNGKIARVRRDATSLTKLDDAHYTVDLGDVYQEEQRDVIVQVERTSSEEEITVEFALRYVDAVAGKVASAATSTTVRFSDDVSANRTSAHVAAQVARLDVAAALHAARDDADRGHFDKAQGDIDAAKAKVREAFQFLPPGESANAALLRRLDFDLDVVKDASRSKQAYDAKGRHQMTSKAYGHAQQRCMSDSDSDEEEGGSNKPRNQYRNAAKKAMKSKWVAKPFFANK